MQLTFINQELNLCKLLLKQKNISNPNEQKTILIF
jgi:hypothetical protein